MYFNNVLRPSTFYKLTKNQIVKDNDSYEHLKNMITVMKWNLFPDVSSKETESVMDDTFLNMSCLHSTIKLINDKLHA